MVLGLYNYTPPVLHLESFNEDFNRLELGLSKCSKEVYLVGDFSIYISLLKVKEHELTNELMN